MIHELKTWPEYFQAIVEGRKRFEIRRDDRPFAVDDELGLREWDPKAGEYTGRFARVRVAYIYRGPLCLPEFCVMSIVMSSAERARLFPQGANP